MSDVIYGIDLGTTNSIIGCNDKLITGLVPSKVDFSTSKTVSHDVVGEHILGSYKVDMGLGKEGEIPIKASSIVLHDLCTRVYELTGDRVKKVVISVPAYFNISQRDAVRKAAELNGLDLVCIVNEPTAAALHICNKDLNANVRKGVFVVYDLGGGTFDCTIIDSRLNGKYQVAGTDGMILGGDDLDNYIVDKVIKKAGISFMHINEVSRAELKYNCEQWKIHMQEAYSSFKDGNYTIGIKIPESFNCPVSEVVFSLDDYKKFVRKVFAPTISIVTGLIDRRIPKGTDFTIVFVGGSTHDTYLCSYVLESCGISFAKAEFDESPDYTVAIGVTKYATFIQNGGKELEFMDVTKQLSIEHEDGSSIVVIPNNTFIPCSKKILLTNATNTQFLRVKLYQGNSLIAKENEFIGIIEYDYGYIVEEGMGEVEVTVSVDLSGFITLEVEDISNFGEKKAIKLKLN